jgi:hypothetical protein
MRAKYCHTERHSCRECQKIPLMLSVIVAPKIRLIVRKCFLSKSLNFFFVFLHELCHAWTQCYKTFSVRNLQILVISLSICPGQVLLA